MHITLLALGSRGDITPIAVLGGGLRTAGYAVRLISFQDFAPLAEHYDLDFHPVKIASKDLIASSAGVNIAESGNNPLRLLIGVMRTFGAISRLYEEAFSDAKILETDAIVNQVPAGLYGFDLAEKLQAPYFTAAVIPLNPTREFALPLLPALPGGRLYNRLSYRIGWQLGWQPMRAALNRFRKLLDLPPAPLGGFERRIRQSPTLNGFSTHVVPRPDDWQPDVHITGYWLPREDGWHPPPALLRFLEAGSAPVFIGFGSMPLHDPEAVTRTILEACRRLGRRVILGAGWGGLGDIHLPAFAHELEYAPYDWLFPRMTAIVHHGGSGTTAFALRSGAPSFVVPFGADQFFWGKRTHMLGAGPKPLAFKRLSVETLSARLEETLHTDSYGLGAARIRQQLLPEDGVATAVQILDGTLRASAQVIKANGRQFSRNSTNLR